MKKVLLVFLSMLLFACNAQEKVILETAGKEYSILDNVSFYYPKEFNIHLNDNNEGISFVDEDEMFKYLMIMNNSDNNIEDYPQLYLGQLQQEGAFDTEYSSIILENEMNCFEYTGIYKLTGIKFKQIVYFTKDATYVYMYQSSEKVYDDKIDIVTQYLRSLTVHNEQVS